jgi:hypothetical protein
MGREFSRRRFMTGALAGGVGMKLTVEEPDGGPSATLEAAPVGNDFSASPPASQGGRWWEQQPLTILDLHTFAGEITRFPAPELAQLKAPLGFNTDTLYVHNLFDGMDDEGFFFRTALAAKENPDYLKEFLPEARKRGMRTTLYFNVHYYTMEFAQKHPDWVQVREGGGTLDKLYGHGTTLCVNSPWRDWVAALMKDLCAYPIDGIFVDGPLFFPETCYCHWCQAKFRNLHGRDLPSKRQHQGVGANELLQFQGTSLAEFMRDINRVIKSANPNILLYGNHTALTGNWATGQVNRRLVKEQDLLASEGGYVYNDLNQTPLWKAGLRARMIETQAGGKPTVIIACPALKPWTHAMLPAAEARLMFADIIANGAGVWMSLTLTEFDRPELQATVAMNRFVKENSQYLHRTRSEASIAVVWSYATANAYSPDAQLIDIAAESGKTEAGNLQREFWGVAEALLRAHAPFDVIDDDALEQADLGRYRALFLPNAACMSDQTAAHVIDYVRNGGGLFATFETSLYDEYGQRRKEFALREALGVSCNGRIAGPRSYDFMRAVSGDPLAAGLPRPLVLSPVYYARVRTDGARPVVRYLEKRLGPYREIPPLSEDPALTVNHLGKGTVVYASGDLGNTIANFHMRDSMAIVENAAAVLAPGTTRLEGAPGTVELVHRSQNAGSRHIFHLVNFTGQMTRPIQEVIPVQGARLVLPQGMTVKRAYALMAKRPLQPRASTTGAVDLALPEFHEYEVVVVETQS